MNKHLHRIIFNAARGIRMVVQETASSTGTGSSRATGDATGKATGKATGRATGRAVVAVGLFGVLVALPGQAQIASGPTVPGHLRPTVLVAPNGVPLVNIQTPSAAGVSRNVYNQFDVARNGAILNNSRVNVQTQLGGFVQGNPWLARGPARVILNEVNGGRPTQLRGHVEVGGARAEVIIANPAGISVDGGGFINASRATLTTGVPQLDASGALEGFLVREGAVSIDGAGLDASQTDHAAILARAVHVNAGIWANELKVVAGANQVRADHGGVHPVAGTGSAPGFALDVAALGGMYARKITLVGTEAGLGVRNAGNVGAGAGGLVVTAQGRLENSGTLEAPRVEITSAADIDNRGGTIRQTGIGGLTVDSAVLNNTRGGVIGAPPLTAPSGPDGTLDASVAMPLPGTASPSVRTAGAIDGGASMPASTQSSAPATPGIVTAAGTIRNEGGRIDAGGPITLKTPQIDNAGGTLNVATMAVTGPGFSNAGGTLNVSQRFDASVGRFDNTGGKLHAGSLNIAASGELVNVGGTIAADTDLSLKASSMETTGAVRAGNDITLDVAGDIINEGRITAGRHAVIGARRVMSGHAGVFGAGVRSDGTTGNAGDLRVTGIDGLVSHGVHQAAGDTTLQGAVVDLSGSRTQAANVGITATQGDVRTDKASIVTPGTLRITANAGGDQGLVNDGGTLSAGRLDLNVSNLANTRGGEIVQTGAEATRVTVAGIFNNDGGRIASNGQGLELDAAAFGNAAGVIEHLGTGTLRIVGGSYSGDRGRISGNGALVVDVAARFAQDGGQTHAGRIGIDAGALSNRGGTISGDSLAIDTRGGTLDNSAKGTLAATGALTLRTGALDNAGGLIRSSDAMRIDAGTSKIDNDGGLIRSDASATLIAAKVVNTNTAGEQQGIEARNLAILSGAEVNNTAGRMLALETLTISDPSTTPGARALSITNTHGVLIGGRPAALDADGSMRPAVGGVHLEADSFSGDGRIVSAGDLGIALVRDVAHNADFHIDGDLSYTTAGKFTNNAKLQAGQTLAVRASDLDNTTHAEMSGRRTVLNASGRLTNRGLIDSQGATQIDAASAVRNIGTGRIYGDAVSVASDAVDNREEKVDGTTRAATIAARETLNIGAGTVSNREHALIFSGGTGLKAMRIGGKLDDKREATESGGVLDNLSARIESLGGMTISMGQINNLDTHVKLGTPTTSKQFSQTIGVEGIAHFKPEDVIYSPGEPDLMLRGPDGSWRPADGHVWGLWDKTVVTTTDTAAEADPATIVSGGDMTLNGAGLNRDSRITARGTLTAPGIRNEALQGEATTQAGYIVHWRAVNREPDVIEPVSRVSKDVGTYVKTGDFDATRGHDMGKASGGAATIVEVPANLGEVVRIGTRPGSIAIGELGSRNASDSRLVPVVVRTSAPATGIPRASLFDVQGGPRGYLVETDPRFANYRNWLSSDYLLGGLGLDPNTTLKRLGDGFYEQKLIREQVAQLTGYRYLSGHHDDEAQYISLMNDGVTFARQYGLRPGIALTAAQMAQLTSDIVWLVEQAVTLPDGSIENVLAPQLYVRVRPGDIDGSGALLSAEAAVIEGEGDLVNTGTIAGRRLVKIDKDNVGNLGGRIAGGNVDIHAKKDLDNIGGTITAADSAVLRAGRDINIETTTRTQGGALASRTNIDRVAGVYVSNPGGILAASAGRDVNLLGGVLANTGADSRTLLMAKRNINVATVKEESRYEVGSDPRQSYSQATSREVGSQIVGSGELSLDAGQDIRIRGSAINAQGDLTVKAREGSVRVETSRETSAIDSASQVTKKGFLSRKTQTRRDSLFEETSIASTLGGRNVTISGQDVTVSGSEVIADKDLSIIAKRNLDIEAALDSRSESSYRSNSRSGLMGSGGFGFTIGSRSQSTDEKAESTRAARSTVGSIAGNTTLVAGNQYTQAGSDVVAPEGDVTIAAKSLAIREARETSRTETEQKQKTGGLTIALTAPVISAVQSIGNTAKAVKQTGSKRMQALGAASAATEAKSLADAMVRNPAQAMGVNLSISLGGSQNKSNSTEKSDTATGSRVEGKNVNLLALGGGKSSNILVQGSDVIAREAATLVADNRIDILAAQNISERHSTNKGSGGSVGVSFGTSGLLFNIGANGSRGKSDGTDTSYTNSNISAGKNVRLVSGGDTAIKGGVIQADQVTAKVGGDLKIESLQDTSISSSNQQSVGGSLSVGVGVWSVGVSASNAKASGNYASVTEQSGIKAGDGGFDVEVKGATDLKGAVIASTQAAVDGEKNSFKSASLTTGDIQNVDDHKASGASLSIIASGEQPKDEDKKPIPGSAYKVGPGGSAGVGSASGKQASVTRAGISGIAGDKGVRTDVDGTNALVKKWDTDSLLKDVQAQTQITQTFGSKAAKAVGDYAGTQTSKYELAQLRAQQAGKVLNDPNASDQQKAQAGTDLADANRTLAEEQQNYENWKEGGTSRLYAHAVLGGLTGNLQGAFGAALASAAAPVIDDLTRNLPESIKGAVGAGLAAGLGVAAGSTGGAATALNADINNRQLHPAEGVLILSNAQAYASRRGISVEQATTELTEQSLRQIDSAWAKRIADNPQAAVFLQEVSNNAGAIDVGGGRLFDARGTASFDDHTVNAATLDRTSDLYNRVKPRTGSGIVPGVRGAYVAYADVGTDPRLAQNTPEQIQQLLNTGRQLRREGQSVREGFAVNAANLGVADAVFTSGLARPGDGSKLTDRAMGEMGEAVLSGLPSEGGAVTTPTRGMRPVAGSSGAGRETGPVGGPEGTVPPSVPSNRRTSSDICSFRGDMQVKTSEGYTQIQDIQVGDKVYARDEVSGALGYKGVLAQYSNPYKETVYVSVKDAAGRMQVIVSNTIHPFFAQMPGIESGTVLPKASEGHDYRGPILHAQWVDAANLKAGYRLLGSSGNWLVVTQTRRTTEPLPAYNLTVADFHTYFVKGEEGLEGVWVHNDCWNALPKDAVATGKTTPDGRLLYTFKGVNGKNITAYQGTGSDTRWYNPAVYTPTAPIPRDVAPVAVKPAEQAMKLGYNKTNYRVKGQPVYFNPNAKADERFISPDVGSGDGSGSHNGGFWKAASAPDELGKKTTRSGTYDENMNRMKE